MTNIQLKDSDILSKDFRFCDKIRVATEVATTLTEVIKTQQLSVNISGNNYVTAEGWNCLGTMLGTYAQTEFVEPIQEPDGYKARVSIKQGDNILATAEAIATFKGFQKTPQAVYSMAQTRAMGKAYRMCFSWIVKLAGFQPTPAEEMEPSVYQADELVFTTADNLPDVEDFIKRLIDSIKEAGLEVNKKNIIRASWEKVVLREISESFHQEIVSWCKGNCPENPKEAINEGTI